MVKNYILRPIFSHLIEIYYMPSNKDALLEELRKENVETSLFVESFKKLWSHWISNSREGRPQEMLLGYFNGLDKFIQSHPQAAGKLLPYLLAEAGYSNGDLYKEVDKRFQLWLGNESISENERLNRGIFCCKNLDYDFKNTHSDVLLRLLISEAKRDPAVAFSIVEDVRGKSSTKNHVFSLFGENIDTFIELSELLKAIDSQYLIQGLEHKLCVGQRKYNNYNPTENDLRETQRQLLCAIKGDLLAHERSLQKIIRDGFLDEPDMELVRHTLQNLENKKSIVDQNTPHNCFVLSLNFSDSMHELLLDRFNIWAKLYEHNDNRNEKSISDHSKNLIDLINGALNSRYPRDRNILLPEPKNLDLVLKAEESFWEMVNFLEAEDSYLALIALKNCAQMGSFKVERTSEMGKGAHELFIKIFPELLNMNPQLACKLLSGIISIYGCTGIATNNIGSLLDKTFPLLAKEQPILAKKCVEDGHRNTMTHGRPWWYPKK